MLFHNQRFDLEHVRVVCVELSQRPGKLEHVLEIAAAIACTTLDLRNHFVQRRVAKKSVVFGWRYVSHPIGNTIGETDFNVLTRVAVLLAVIQMREYRGLYEERPAVTKLARGLDQRNDAPRSMCYAAVIVRSLPEAPAPAFDVRRPAIAVRKVLPPDQRSITENPVCFVHCETDSDATLLQPGNVMPFVLTVNSAANRPARLYCTMPRAWPPRPASARVPSRRY